MLHIQNLSKQYGARALFEETDAHLGYRSRVALIGPNGSGKTTLIRMIIGEESPDAGTISRAGRLSIGYLSQNVPKFSGRTVLEEIMRLDGRREELLEEKKSLEAAFAESGTGSGLERYGRLQEELECLDEYRLESRAKAILLGMGFKEKDYLRPLTELSGGWLMRVALSRILLIQPDLLLLDEPTNHLDLESLLWLEEFLRAFRGAMLVVSHDRAFLNRLVTEVWELDQKQVWSYSGNIDSFAVQKEERLQLLRAKYDSQQSRMEALEAFITRFGAKATKARQAQSRAKQLEKIQNELVRLPEHRQTIRFRFPQAPYSGKEVFTVKNATVSYGTNAVFKNLDWVIQRGRRVAVVGVNGAGKTTLLKLLAGQLDPASGTATLGHLVKPGYYAQHQAEILNLGNTVLQELEAMAPLMPVSQVRAVAGAFLLTGDAVEKKCAILSGGEKARVALAKLLLSPSNFLILDEPTNHLDADSREVLLDALKNFAGTLCVVSHDRSFIGPLVDTVLEIIPPGSGDGSRVVQLVCGYEDYLSRIEREAREKIRTTEKPVEKAAAAVSLPETPRGPSNNQKNAWRRELSTLENDIDRLESRQSEIHAMLAGSEIYEQPAELSALISEQAGISKTLAAKLERWAELEELLR